MKGRYLSSQGRLLRVDNFKWDLISIENDSWRNQGWREWGMFQVEGTVNIRVQSSESTFRNTDEVGKKKESAMKEGEGQPGNKTKFNELRKECINLWGEFMQQGNHEMMLCLKLDWKDIPNLPTRLRIGLLNAIASLKRLRLQMWRPYICACVVAVD